MKGSKQITSALHLKVFLFSLLLSDAFLINPVNAQTLENDSIAVSNILVANRIPANNILLYVIARDGRIEELRLPGLDMTVLPSDIGDLSALVYLDLSDNFLSVLPEEIGNLSDIEKIYLQNNGLSELPAAIASIPRSRTIQTVEYGCQITYDGECIAYGDVLVTKTVNTIADLSFNALCNESAGTTSWANAVDPDWSDTQKMDPGQYCDGTHTAFPSGSPNNGELMIRQNALSQNVSFRFSNTTSHKSLLIYNIRGHLVKNFINITDSAEWNTENQNKGVYLLRMDTGNQQYFKQFVLIN